MCSKMALCFFMFVGVVLGVPLQDDYKYIEVNPFIHGGDEAPEGYAPHMVALVFGSVFKSFQCGASIVSTRHVLTAAHCIDPLIVWGELIPTLRGVIGSNRWISESLTVRFSHHINHPDWDMATIKNDVGILFLDVELLLNEKVAAVPLDFQHVDRREKCSVTGWGRNEQNQVPDNLSLLYLHTIPSEECARRIHEETANWWAPPSFDPVVEICTLHDVVGHGMCFGDSGSALVSRQTGHQIGIVSWGFPCARGLPDIFVRIAGVRDFLLPILSQR